MRRTCSWITLLLAVMALGLTGCAKVDDEVKKVSASKVEAVEGTALQRVVLNPGAEKRLDIQTAKVREATPQEITGLPAGQPGRTAMSYEALIYDKKGATFAYTNPKDLDYVRAPVTVEAIKDKVVLLASGPPVGTSVVVVGAVLLYGVETGVGK
ncbi:MAG: hypothetical protein WKF86_02375 [Acidimicrobiales bacterium]